MFNRSRRSLISLFGIGSVVGGFWAVLRGTKAEIKEPEIKEALVKEQTVDAARAFRFVFNIKGIKGSDLSVENAKLHFNRRGEVVAATVSYYHLLAFNVIEGIYKSSTMNAEYYMTDPLGNMVGKKQEFTVYVVDGKRYHDYGSNAILTDTITFAVTKEKT